jgi:hypothetical protein
MTSRVKDAGGVYDRSTKAWVLPACAGFPEVRISKIEDAFAEAVKRRTEVQKHGPVGPVYAHRYHY